MFMIGDFVYRFKVLDRELKRTLKDIEKKSSESFRDIIKESTWRIKLSAKMRAPRDTGALRESIGTRINLTPIGVTGVIFAGGDKTTRTEGKNAPFDYTRAQEYGYAPHIVSPRHWKGTNPPEHPVMVRKYTPFMEPALSQYFKRGLERTIEKHLNRVIK